jgi:alkanesulfonate monooxygenase SsuD/methylene tetrahydromethanopterin reductase-like flavin-dependent oxidoreductase (luciferase family)
METWSILTRSWPGQNRCKSLIRRSWLAARRAIRYGDGWCPIGGRPGSSPLDVLEQFRKMARDAGRDPQSLPITVFNPPEDADELARYRDMGVSRVVIMLLSEPSDAILPILDRWAQLIRRTA